MRIEQIEPITLRVPWGPADWGEFREWTIVRGCADDGRVGIGRGGDPRLIRSEFEDLLVRQSLEVQGPRGCYGLDLRCRYCALGPAGTGCRPFRMAALGRL